MIININITVPCLILFAGAALMEVGATGEAVPFVALGAAWCALAGFNYWLLNIIYLFISF